MKLLKAIFLPAIFCLSLLSCKTKVDNIQLSRTDDAAVLFGFLNPDADTITVALSLAKGVSTHKEKIISFADLENAEVQLVHNGQSVNLAFLKVVENQGWSNGNRLFVFYALRSQFPVLPGETYSVSARNGDIFELKAITTVPSEDFDFEYEVSGPFHTPDWLPEYKVAVTVRDPGKGIGFMRTVAQVKNQYHSYNSMDEITIPEHQSDGSIKYNYSFFLETDNGEEEVILNISNVSESYYRYMQSVEKGDGESHNPFAEPTSMYTNIEGGYGVFSALCLKSKRIK